MDHYIELLIEDLHAITGERPLHEENTEERVHDDETFFRHIENVEKYLHGNTKPIASITGITWEQLPPPEKLSKKQQAQLSVELEKFLRYFHFELDFPHRYPNDMRYPFIKNFWKEEHVPLSFGSTHIEFCDYDKENCPFDSYCTICDEIVSDIDDFDMEKYDGCDENE